MRALRCLSIVALLTACEGRPPCPPGDPGCPCAPDGSCAGGRVCSDELCLATGEGDAGRPCWCEASPPSCVDGNTLRTYRCAAGACEPEALDAPCADGCRDGGCVGEPCAGVVCDRPPSPCFRALGTCRDGACSYASADGARCDDGNVCTLGDTCAAGVCAGEPVACGSPPPPTCVGSSLRTYASAGSCAAGACSYPFTDRACTFGCSGGACDPDPCASIACTSPPTAMCLGSTARTYGAGSCVAGACEYPFVDAACEHGCSAGACNPDPCSSTCNSPPAPVCIEDILRQYFGSCDSGTCRYLFTDRRCEHGCTSGACNPPPCTAESCTSPPAPFCPSTTTRRSYSGPGTCESWGCSYLVRDEVCAFGCAGGECRSGTGVVELAGGNRHTCARRDTGRVACWGANGDGQLGDGTTTARRAPAAVLDVTDAQAITAGASHTCALIGDGTVACWGSNVFGQLGNGAASSVDRPRAVAVVELTGAVEVIAGGNHSCARRADGSVACWGNNLYGQLGDGTTSHRDRPVAVVGLGDAIQLAGSYYHTCALRAGGSVVCWGDNGNGRLGNGTTTASAVPVAVEGLDDAVEISGGSGFVCARRAGGAMSCWGSNLFGQLGDGTTTHRTTPTAVSRIADAVEIEAGGVHACARRPSGSVRCWGFNSRGAVGDGTTTNRPTPVSVVGGLGDARQLGAGGGHVCALRSSSAVVCWGENADGQLGDGTLVDRLVPTEVRGL